MRISDWSSDVCSSDLLDIYDDIDPELRTACEDVVLNRDPDAGERLVALAERYRGSDPVAEKQAAEWREWDVNKRLEHSSEERRGGKECVGRWRSGWSP